jgi:hypothetical protein
MKPNSHRPSKSVSPSSDAALEALINAKEGSITAPALIAAAAKYREQQEERQAELALQIFREGSSLIAQSVELVRKARKSEKNEVNRLKAYSEAYEVFKKDGKISEYNAKIVAADVAYSAGVREIRGF